MTKRLKPKTERHKKLEQILIVPKSYKETFVEPKNWDGTNTHQHLCFMAGVVENAPDEFFTPGTTDAIYGPVDRILTKLCSVHSNLFEVLIQFKKENPVGHC